MAILSRIRVALAILTAVLLSARPVYAEDIEIYLVSGEESGGANVLLLIDNSGGTNRRFPGTAYSEGGKTIDEIAYALDLVLGGLAGATRLGVASQLAGGDNGGAINYPVKQIDEKSAPVGIARVTSPQGDAYQYMTVPSVPLAVDDATIGWKPFPNLTDVPDADADNIHILLEGRLDDHLGSLVQTGVDDLHARVPQGRRNHLGPPVMSVKTGFGDQHSNLFRHMVSSSIPFSRCWKK